MKNKIIGLDTNIFIYQFQGNSQFGEKTQKIFTQLTANKINALTSVITITEILSFKKSEEIVSELKALLLEVPNLEIKDVTKEIP